MAANLALKELRERQGLTQSGLARRLGISRGTVRSGNRRLQDQLRQA